MNAVIAPCLSALLLLPLLLLLLASSTYEQVCAVCTLSGAADATPSPKRSKRDAAGVENAVVPSVPVGAARPPFAGGVGSPLLWG
jgi:zona occludens toxin (predicted ATPase)